MSNNNVINGRSVLNGTLTGVWTQGLSAYDLDVRYNGFRGDVRAWLKSLKAFSPEVGEVVEEEDGVRFVLTDENGEHEIFLPNGKDGKDGEDGKDITITNTETTEEGDTLVTFSTGQTITIPRGVVGETGKPGREIILVGDRQGVVYWRYNENDNNWKEVVDLGILAHAKFEEELNNHEFVKIVDELPDPADAEDGVMYVLRKEV